MIDESPVNLECKVTEIKRLGTHDMFMAEIVAMHVNEEIVDEKGKIDLASTGLLAYAHGEYFGLKKAPLGKFGYSVMKPKTKKRINKEKHAERVEKNKAKRSNKVSNTNGKSSRPAKK